MKNQFETLMEGQKKLFDFWTDTAKNAAAQFAPGKQNGNGNGNGKAAEMLATHDAWAEWFERQKAFFENATTAETWQEAFRQSPEQFKNWAKLQTEFSEKWLQFYRENVEKFGVKMPLGERWNAGLKENSEAWFTWLEDANKWVQENMLAKLPFPQQPHFENFAALYKTFFGNWETLQKMMKNGVWQADAVEKFFPQQDFREAVGRLFNFRPLGDVDEWLNGARQFFDNYLEFLKQSAPGEKSWQEQWNKAKTTWQQPQSDWFKAALDANRVMEEGLTNLYHVAGQGKEMEMAKELKDIQFASAAFVLRNAELQSKIFEASAPVLSKTLELFAKKFQEKGQLPDFQAFFKKYLDDLETMLTPLMASDEYSGLQNETSRLGVKVKSHLDKFTELAFSGLPFLMQSHADELAQELAALRQKMRRMEERLAALEMQPAEEVAAGKAKPQKIK